MSLRTAPAALELAALMVLSPSVFAVSAGDSVTFTTRAVYQAFSRYSAPIDSITLEKKAPPQKGDLFPQYGFSPRSFDTVSWFLNPSSDDTSNFCVQVQVRSAVEWNAALIGLSRNGLHAADPQTCAQLSRFDYAPPAFPAYIAGMTTWDRRDIPSATVLPSYPVIQGADASAVTRPGLTIVSGSGSVLAIYNPYVPVATVPPVVPPPGMVVGITSVSVRPEFTVTHQCSVIPSESTCSLRVQYTGTTSVLAGQLLIYFSNGAIANVGLLGRIQ